MRSVGHWFALIIGWPSGGLAGLCIFGRMYKLGVRGLVNTK